MGYYHQCDAYTAINPLIMSCVCGINYIKVVTYKSFLYLCSKITVCYE